MNKILTLAILLIGSFTAKAADKPNFIVILTDDQSWVGSSLQVIPDDPRTRSEYFKTLHIERMAAMGMRFTQGHSPAASCCPTRRSIPNRGVSTTCPSSQP